MDSSSSELEELGINMQEFKQKRSVRLGTRRTESPVQRDNQDPNLPIELQYDELLNKGMEILNRNNKSAMTSKVKLPLEVKREGRKTIINIKTISEALNRNMDHLVKYITTDLVTNGAVNSDGKLWLKGIYIKSEIQEVLRRYIEHFVVCKICNNVEDTGIIKKEKLYFLKCYKCGGEKCIGNIVDGLSTKGKVKPQLRGML